MILVSVSIHGYGYSPSITGPKKILKFLVVFTPGKVYGLRLYQKLGHALGRQCRGGGPYWPCLTKARIFIVYRFTIEYSNLRDFGPHVIIIIIIIIGLF
jgi:hypothetical protein